MFSSKKIMMSAGRVVPPTPTPTPTPTPNLSLQIISQPQDETVPSNAFNARIGETTWQSGSGYARSNVIWERSIDGGATWSYYGGSSRQDGALVFNEVSSFMNGNMFRAKAHSYQPFTSLANFSSPLAAEELSVPEGNLRIFSNYINASVEFLVNRSGSFYYSINTIVWDRSYPITLSCSVLNKNILSESGTVELVVGDIVRFSFSTTQPVNFYPKNSYQFEFLLGQPSNPSSVPYDSPAVVSNPITLTVA